MTLCQNEQIFPIKGAMMKRLAILLKFPIIYHVKMSALLLVAWLIWFYGISTFVGYLMPGPVYT